jgi:hypothetical protein
VLAWLCEHRATQPPRDHFIRTDADRENPWLDDHGYETHKPPNRPNCASDWAARQRAENYQRSKVCYHRSNRS